MSLFVPARWLLPVLLVLPSTAPAERPVPRPESAPAKSQTPTTVTAAGATPHSAPLRTATDSARHLLNRLAFGPRPGEVDAVAAGGIQRWIDAQLRARHAGDPALRDRESQFDALRHSRAALAQAFADRRRDALQRQQDAAASGDSTRLRPARGRGVIAEAGQELQSLMLLRAVASERQLGEVLTDFWFNHFNVYARKGPVIVGLPAYLEDAIRPHVLDRFDALLLAVAESPAMLLYLDNAQSVATGSAPPALRYAGTRAAHRRLGRAAGVGPDSAAVLMEQLVRRRPTGLNENFARELLELHTLGVDGGYTQRDVQEVARIFTGWSVAPLRRGGGFVFNSWAHDDGPKTVLGVTYPAGHGRDEGRALVRQLARHPATAAHIGGKLCARFVADQPPAGCVRAAVVAWQRTDGDLREVVRAIVTGRDFWDPVHVGTKVKSPFEFVVSALRATGAEPMDSRALPNALGTLGQPLFQQASPAGYPEHSALWSSSGALLARMTFATALAAGTAPGVRAPATAPAPAATDPDTLLNAVGTALMGGPLSPATHAAIKAELATATDPAAARTLAVGLALGGPDFQRH